MKSRQLVSVVTLALMGAWLMAARPGDVMTELGIETQKLRHDVLLNLKESGWFSFQATGSMRQTARRIPESSRAATVRMLGNVVRAYVESGTFKQAWLQDLKNYYPYDDSYSDENLARKQQEHTAEKAAMKQQLASVDQAFAHMDPALVQMAVRAQLAQGEQEFATLTGDDRTSQARTVAALKKMLALPAPELKKQYLNYIKQQANPELTNPDNTLSVDQEQLAQQRQQKAEFDAHADFRPLLKKRLQEFIALSETVDFDARLVPMGYKQEFANPLYQHKPSEWKFLYRLGKEPAMEARRFAQQWLAELP